MSHIFGGFRLYRNNVKLCCPFSSEVRPFTEIPGPRSLPLVGTLWKYMPLWGEYEFDRLHRNGLKKFKKYGPVVKEEIVPGQNVIWIFRPEDVKELLQREGQFPQRRSHLAIQHIRLKKPEIYTTGGLLPTNGPEWLRLRSNFQKGLSSIRNIRNYLPQVNATLDQFLQFIEAYDYQQDFLQYLNRLFLEILGTVAFGVNFNSFSPEEIKPDSHSSKLIAAAFEANSCILKTDNGPQLWRLFPTPMYKRLKLAHDYMEESAIHLIKRRQQYLSEHGQQEATCLIDHYLQCPNLHHKDIVGMGVDIILAGVDTTSYTSSFVLYHLARNPKEQDRLFNEISEIMGDKEIVEEGDLGQSHYVKAVMKESLRLNPVSVGVGRILAEDANFSGYHVPKNTVVVTQSQVVCRLEEFFSNPDFFIPERWLKASPIYEAVSPYLLLPFGHGVRTCIARRMAEQNIQLLILKLIRKYKIEWKGGNLDCKSLLINKPDGPISIKFTPRI